MLSVRIYSQILLRVGISILPKLLVKNLIIRTNSSVNQLVNSWLIWFPIDILDAFKILEAIQILIVYSLNLSDREVENILTWIEVAVVDRPLDSKLGETFVKFVHLALELVLIRANLYELWGSWLDVHGKIAAHSILLV